MALTVRVESTYTTKLVALERLCALARQQGMTDDAEVLLTENGRRVEVAEQQAEAQP